MCGILGFASKDRIEDGFAACFRTALRTMDHRGPDGEGIFSDPCVFLGHKRLSIIDLSSEANQPFRATTSGAQLIFNGEIYNYQEISNGLALRTKSDTEVLLEGFLRDGAPFLKTIRGIYAAAIYDPAKAKLFLFRDPAGVKPLYYAYDELKGELIFASELKAIMPLLPELGINEEAVKLFIHLGYCPEPGTVYRNIFAAEPGSLLTFDLKTGKLDVNTFAAYDFLRQNAFTAAENMAATAEKLKTACRRNLVADVPVNLALSGGIDSSLVLAFSAGNQQINAITVKFDEQGYDESEVATRYARQLNANHRVVTTHADSKLELIEKLLLHFDQPYADSSLLPFYFLNHEAAKHSKVIVGGDSGDEIQNGYSGFGLLPLVLALGKGRARRPAAVVLSLMMRLTQSADRYRQLAKIRRMIVAGNRAAAIFEWNSWFTPSADGYRRNPFRYDAPKVFENFAQPGGNPDQAFITENYFRRRMQSDYLRKADMMSMINSVEFRVPMLDEDLVAFSLSIPYGQKSGIRHQKKIFRELHRRIYPSDTSRRKKQGFSIPLDTWLGREHLASIRDFILQRDGIVQTYIDTGYVGELFETLASEDRSLRKFCSRASAYQRILILYSLQLWYTEKFRKHTCIRLATAAAR